MEWNQYLWAEKLYLEVNYGTIPERYLLKLGHDIVIAIHIIA